MSQALYRKYRSKSLAEVIGQEHITNTLSRALNADGISHAYLFTGPRGVGKTSIARILAHQINKLPYNDTPHLDIIEIDAASNRRIDDIRDLRDKVHITPVQAAYKVYIIDEVHMLTGESFNALLKTLEEPPAHVVFILATTEAHKLPATIISRTQRFTFRPVHSKKVIAHLKYIADKEGIPINDDALELIAQHGEGSFRDSIGLLDQLAHATDTSKTINAQDVAETLGIAPAQHVKKLTEAIQNGDQPAIGIHLDEILAQGVAPHALVNQLTSQLLLLAHEQPRLYTLIDALLEVPRAYKPELKLLTTLMLAQPLPQPKQHIKSAPALVAAPPDITIATAAPAQPDKPTISPAVSDLNSNTASNPLTELTANQWHIVLDAAKKASPPAYSVLKWAEPDFNADSQKLVLKMKYQLHKKKADDPKQKAFLAHIIQETLGSSVIIETAIDAQATPPPKAPTDETAAKVASIMGGGEVINA